MDSVSAKILIVDDVLDNLEILGDLLTFKGYSVETAESGRLALERVKEYHPDLVLLDVLMPGLSGYEICERLKADEKTKDIPVVFVSSMTDLESKVKGFNVGGVDYINKPFQHAEVLVRVNTHITMQRLRRDLEDQNAKLEHLANTDYLTSLYNRRRFFQLATEEFSTSRNNGTHLSISLIDIDFFKRVNDTHGHLVGDQVLIHIANIIKDSCREDDMIARYGGEEFSILHPGLGGSEACKVADSIREAVAATPYVTAGNVDVPATISIGVTDNLTCKDCPRIDDMIGLADVALYRAKDAGRNRVVLFEDLRKNPRS